MSFRTPGRAEGSPCYSEQVKRQRIPEQSRRRLYHFLDCGKMVSRPKSIAFTHPPTIKTPPAGFSPKAETICRPESLSSQHNLFPIEKHQQRLVKTPVLHRFEIDISLDDFSMFMMLDPFPLQQPGATHIYDTLARFVRGVIRHENERKRNILFRQPSHLRNGPI